MKGYKLVYTKQAKKDAKKLKSAGLKSKAKHILEVLEKNPFPVELEYKKLVGDLAGAFSIRINKQHRIVYQVYEQEKAIKIIRMWTHYE